MWQRIFLFIVVCILTQWASHSFAQSTNNDSQIKFADWGEAVRDVHLAILITNDIVAAGSDFVIFIRMENGSSNIIYSGESTSGGNYAVELTSGSGKIYRLTREQLVETYSMLLPLGPSESRYWVKLVGVDRYYERPGIVATKKNVPPGDYKLEVARTFLPEKDAKPVLLKSNMLNVKIE